MTEKETAVESKLIPILREGVEVVKMVLFLKLKDHLSERCEWEKEYKGKIIGAVVNDIFGVINPDEIFVEFARENEVQINEIMAETPEIFNELLLTLTDALRVMVLCDHQDGVDNSGILAAAQEKGLLLADRDLPMPHTFIDLARRLGSYYSLYTTPASDTTTN